MAKYTVRYRDSSGVAKVTEIDAEDRAGVFAALKEMGVSAISVTEGAVMRASSRRVPPSALRGAVAGVAVVVLAVAAWLVLRDPGAARPVGADKPSGTAAIGESKRFRPRQATNTTQRTKVKAKTVDDALANVGAAPVDAGDFAATKEAFKSVFTNRTFSTGTEQLMSWVFTTELGDMPMPIPHLSEEDKQQIASVLIIKNEVKEGDSDRVKDCKQTVDMVKKEMAKFIGEGGDPDEFLQYYQRQLLDAFAYRNEAKNQVQELASEDPELAAQFLSKVNERLESEGIKKITSEEVE